MSSLDACSVASSLDYGSENSLEDIHTVSMSVSTDKAVFVNKSVNLDKIGYYGFDMDYTLCEYISPQFDKLAFNLASRFMVDSLNYPAQILDLEFNPRFPRRGLWYDKELGNLLKVDQFGKILICCHGFNLLQGEELRALYPTKIQRKDPSRICVMNTLFNLAETHLIASLTHFMDNRLDRSIAPGGWTIAQTNTFVSYKQLFEDIREAIENLHEEKILKVETINNLQNLVIKDTRLPAMLKRIRESGRKTFLLTNSDWWYTNHIMSFLLGTSTNFHGDWLSYFDLCVVDARKPSFFDKQTNLNYVHTQTGCKTSVHGGGPPPGPLVYSGGNHQAVTRLLGAEGPDVIYCGDHLHADVVKCRKLCEWRTMLIVPELKQEVGVSREVSTLLLELKELEGRNDRTTNKNKIWENIKRIDQSFGHTGSIFRAGTQLSYFGSQVLVWSDLYSGSVNNLYSYGLSHRFHGPLITLPHEMISFPSSSSSSSSTSSNLHDTNMDKTSVFLVGSAESDIM